MWLNGQDDWLRPLSCLWRTRRCRYLYYNMYLHEFVSCHYTHTCIIRVLCARAFVYIISAPTNSDMLMSQFWWKPVICIHHAPHNTFYTDVIHHAYTIYICIWYYDLIPTYRVQVYISVHVHRTLAASNMLRRIILSIDKYLTLIMLNISISVYYNI